jgi:sodium transport system permease protein
MSQILTIARKEIADGLRDSRSVVASVAYALMGPVVVGLVSMTVHGKTGSEAVLTGMMAIFTLVSGFVGGMNVAMDTVAGERERKSLLPLLMNAVPRTSIVLGKWLAVSFFAIGGLAINVLGFLLVFKNAGIPVTASSAELFFGAFGLFTLPFLAAAIQLCISTISRGVKEAQTYLSLVTFVPMGMGMFLVFCPAARRAWCSFLPVVGQQLQLEALMSRGRVGFLEPVVLGYLTLAVSVFVLLLAANRLKRDEIIYGN